MEDDRSADLEGGQASLNRDAPQRTGVENKLKRKRLLLAGSAEQKAGAKPRRPRLGGGAGVGGIFAAQRPCNLRDDLAKAGCADLGAQQQRDKVKAVRCKGELLPGEADIVSGNNLRLQR